MKTASPPTLSTCKGKQKKQKKLKSEKMANIFAEQLNKLMGKDRNEIKVDKDEDFDPSNCPYYLYDFCPHELFTNTKADLGEQIPSSLFFSNISHTKKKVLVLNLTIQSRS